MDDRLHEKCGDGARGDLEDAPVDLVQVAQARAGVPLAGQEALQGVGEGDAARRGILEPVQAVDETANALPQRAAVRPCVRACSRISRARAMRRPISCRADGQRQELLDGCDTHALDLDAARGKGERLHVGPHLQLVFEPPFVEEHPPVGRDEPSRGGADGKQPDLTQGRKYFPSIGSLRPRG